MSTTVEKAAAELIQAAEVWKDAKTQLNSARYVARHSQDEVTEHLRLYLHRHVAFEFREVQNSHRKTEFRNYGESGWTRATYRTTPPNPIAFVIGFGVQEESDYGKGPFLVVSFDRAPEEWRVFVSDLVDIKLIDPR